MQYEMHVQCDCGGSLVIVASPSDQLLFELDVMEQSQIWLHPEILTFKHLGVFVERCLEFKDEVMELLKNEPLRRKQGLLGIFISREIHG